MDVAQAPQYQVVGSMFQATDSLSPEMSFEWSATVTSASSPNPGININIEYGGGTDTSSTQVVFIPWGFTNSYVVHPGTNPYINVVGTVNAVYSTGGSAVVSFTGNMVYPNVNNIICSSATVLACMAG